MAEKKKQHPTLGEMPKAKGGSRPLDHPSCGTMPKSVDNTRLASTKYAGGKGHPSAGSVPRLKNPAPVFFTNEGRFKVPKAK
jgi:hypothetical protein